MGVRDDVTAYLIDEALDARLTVDEANARTGTKPSRLDPALRYATEEDHADPYPSRPVASPHPELVGAV
jgi:hypothetical protein